MGAPDPNARKIGEVANINGTTTTVYVNDNMVMTDGPLELIGGELKKFCTCIARAWQDVREWERNNAGEDGGDEASAERTREERARVTDSLRERSER